MKFTDLFIRRPVLAIVINLIIIITGIQAIFSLNVRQYPRSDNASVKVTTVYIGADAQLVRGFITTPLELAIAAADGIDYIESQSALGLSTITARLKINYDPIKALAEISAKVDQVKGELPPESETPVIDIESADSQFASAYLSFSSDILEENEITDYLIRVVQPRLSAIAGVQKADVLGQTFAMRIWLDPQKMAAFKVTPQQLQNALYANNVLSTVGRTDGNLERVYLTANTDLQSVEEFKRLIIRDENGAAVRLEDVAQVSLGAENYDTNIRFSGKTAVFVGIWALPNANAIDVIASVRTELEDIQKALPVGLNAEVAYDATIYINNAIEEVIKTIIETLCIVIVVIFLFLGSIRSSLIPIVAIPLSLIGAIFLIQLFGFTLNLLTLLAIVLSVGLVVDDAIVVVENVERHLSEGQPPVKAAILSARELVMPLISMTLTLAAVYMPIAFQGGLTGALFKEFALTLAGAVTISGIVALTLSPMMASRLLKKNDRQGLISAKINQTFEQVKQRYRAALKVTLTHRKAVYCVWVLVGLLTIPMVMLSPSELAPAEDQGVIFGIIEAPANASLEYTDYFAEQAEQAFWQTPETDFTFQVINPSSGFSGMILKPWSQRERTVFDIIPEVQQRSMAIPGVRILSIAPPALPGGGQFPIEFSITSTAPVEEILEIAQQVRLNAIQSGMFAFPPIIDVKMDQPQSELRIDRDKVADLGLSLQQVSQDLGILINDNYVNRFNLTGRSYKVIPQIERNARLTPEQLEEIYISDNQGDLILLSSVASLYNSTQPRSLNRMQQLNAVTLSGVPIRPLNQALGFLEQETQKIMPKGYVLDYKGQSRQLRVEGGKFLPAFSLAILLIFLVLAAQFNSFRDPLIILAGSVPLAIFGALIFTFFKIPMPNMSYWTDGWTTTLNIYSQVGLVTLVGLIAKNGILIVEFANQLQRQGQQKFDAVYQAAIIRLRPVLMTTMATIAGHIPLVFVSGAGASARNSIGLVIVGGMTIGTLFTLFVVPALYMLIARDHVQEGTQDDSLDIEMLEAGS